MTGRYPFHTGLGPDVICTSCGDPYGLPSREVLMPALLREAGYTTAAIGKYEPQLVIVAPLTARPLLVYCSVAECLIAVCKVAPWRL